MKPTLGIIGFGNMGSALAEQLKAYYQLWIFDKDNRKLEGARGVVIADNTIALVNNVDTVIIAVKPQDSDTTISEIRNAVSGKVFISIAAGIRTGHIEKRLGKVRVIRAMPNMPAKIGKGLTCLCKGKFALDEDLAFAKKLFEYVGKSLIIDESLMNAATAVSGSGPGYYFDRIESRNQEYKRNPDKFLKDFNTELTDAAISVNFSQQDAEFLAVGTGTGSNLYFEKAKISPSEAKKQIISKGGTTEAGLEALHRTGSLVEAVKAASKRAKELSQEE